MDIFPDSLLKVYTIKWTGVFGKINSSSRTETFEIYRILASFDSLIKKLLMNENKICAWSVLNQHLKPTPENGHS